MHHTPKPRSVAYADATATFSWVVSEVRVRARVGVRALVRVSMGLVSSPSCPTPSARPPGRRSLLRGRGREEVGVGVGIGVGW